MTYMIINGFVKRNYICQVQDNFIQYRKRYSIVNLSVNFQV